MIGRVFLGLAIAIAMVNRRQVGKTVDVKRLASRRRGGQLARARVSRLQLIARSAVHGSKVLLIAVLATAALTGSIRGAPSGGRFPDLPKAIQLAAFPCFEIHDFPLMEVFQSQGQ